MISPENFYHIIYSNFVKSDRDVLWVPEWNGAKQVEDLVLYPEPSEPSSMINRLLQRPMIMYDQEPLMEYAIGGFRNRLASWSLPPIDSIPQVLPSPALIAFYYHTSSFPIWCHSQILGDQMAQMIDYQFIPCYYWYHAFVSRDWFRHWHYHDGCKIFNKSSSAYRFLLYCREVTGTREYRMRMLEQLSRIRHSIDHDWHKQHAISADYSAKIIPDDAACAIHLVAETLFDTNEVYLTEKVFKPMVMSQPFIIFGPPGTLAVLRRYGFKTFDNVWDESYDQETDHDRRMDLILQLIMKINDLPADGFYQMYQRCMVSIEHNRQFFFSTEFMDVCWQELCANFSSAVSIRSDLEQQLPGGQLFHLLDLHPEMLNIPLALAAYTKSFKQLDEHTQRQIQRVYPITAGLA